MFFKNLFNQPLNVGDRHPEPDAVIEIDKVTPEIQNYIDRGWGALIDDKPVPPKTPPVPPADDPSKADLTKGDKK